MITRPLRLRTASSRIAQLLRALTANPDVWAKMVLLITSDENDGFFEHVVAPAARAARLASK